MRIGLVGDAEVTGDEPAPAAELFTAPVFRAAAAYAARACDAWFVLDVRHGLVHPATVLHPGARALVTERSLRERWARRVIRQLLGLFVPGVEIGGDPAALARCTFELHASRRYRDVLADALRCYGARVEAPVAGLRPAQQLAWYRARRVIELDEHLLARAARRAAAAAEAAVEATERAAAALRKPTTVGVAAGLLVLWTCALHPGRHVETAVHAHVRVYGAGSGAAFAAQGRQLALYGAREHRAAIAAGGH